MSFEKIYKTIGSIESVQISNKRKEELKPFIDFIQEKVSNNKNVNLNFICTHNSRRSHLSQVWAQVAA